MKIYRLKEKYPNSPEVGFMINATQSEFYDYKPLDYPHLWECFESDKTIMSADGYLLSIGDKAYCVNVNKVHSITITEHTIASSFYENKLYKSEEKCSDFINSMIDVQIENERIVGENIKLYGVCVSGGGGWQLGEVTSFRLFDRPHSPNWKYFRTISERTNYINDNKPQYSKKELIGLVEEVGVVCRSLKNEGDAIETKVIKLDDLNELFKLKELK